MLKVILASKSKVRKDILNNNNIQCLVEPANIDEDAIKNSLIKEGAPPEEISKNLIRALRSFDNIYPLKKAEISKNLIRALQDF